MTVDDYGVCSDIQYTKQWCFYFDYQSKLICCDFKRLKFLVSGLVNWQRKKIF